MTIKRSPKPQKSFINKMNFKLNLFDPFWSKRYKAKGQTKKNIKSKIKPILSIQEKQEIEFNKLVNSMSNHKRNKWARAGYPGLRHKDPKPLSKFI